jgi:uncharacterized protein
VSGHKISGWGALGLRPISIFNLLLQCYQLNYSHWSSMNINEEKDTPQLPSIEIPPQTISEDALLGVIGEFILRDGTDYGLIEVSHATKVEQIQRQLTKGEVKIIFDPNTETVTMMTAREWSKLLKSQPDGK